MELTVHVHHHIHDEADKRIMAALSQILANQATQTEREIQMDHSTQEIIAKVSQGSDDVQSVKTLMEALRDKVNTVPKMPADVQADLNKIFDSLTGNNQTLEALASAITTTPGDTTGTTTPATGTDTGTTAATGDGTTTPGGTTGDTSGGVTEVKPI